MAVKDSVRVLNSRSTVSTKQYLRMERVYKRKKSKLRLAQMSHTIIFSAALFLFGILSLVLTKPTESIVEKRELAAMPRFSVDALVEGSYTRDLEMHYADTFPMRDSFVRLAAQMDEMRGIRYDGVRIHNPAAMPQTPAVVPVLPDLDILTDPSVTDEVYTPHVVEDDGATGEQNGAVFVYKEKAMSIFGGTQGMAEWYAEAISAYQQAWGDSVQVYNIVVPTAIEFALPERYKSVTSPQDRNIGWVYDALDPKVKSVDAYTAIEQHANEYVYFNADHHWTGLGAYYAYTAFAKEAGLTPHKLDEYDVRTIEDFKGTMYAQTNDAKLAADHVDYYVAPTEHTAVRFDRGAPYTEMAHSVFAEYASGGNSYSVFLHGDYPLIRVDTELNNGKKVLIVKESYGNAFAPFLISHYEQVYIVDQRYFEQGLVSFVQENGIQEVIFLNNIFAANTGYHIECIESLMY